MPEQSQEEGPFMWETLGIGNMPRAPQSPAVWANLYVLFHFVLQPNTLLTLWEPNQGI